MDSVEIIKAKRIGYMHAIIDREMKVRYYGMAAPTGLPSAETIRRAETVAAKRYPLPKIRRAVIIVLDGGRFQFADGSWREATTAADGSWWEATTPSEIRGWRRCEPPRARTSEEAELIADTWNNPTEEVEVEA